VFERVFTVTDYYDGPRAGIADLDGVPHFYESEWADGEDLDADVFKLSPVPEDVLPLALEDWQIWRRWEVAFHRGEATQETHPALPIERARHDELVLLLADRAGVDASNAVRASGTFRARPDLDEYGLGFHPLEVEWKRLQDCRNNAAEPAAEPGAV
jgi:hypothetical protein